MKLAAARLSIQLGLQDVAGMRASLAACVDGGAAPLSVASTSRILLDAYRPDSEIDRLPDKLHDGAKPYGPWVPGSLGPWVPGSLVPGSLSP